MDLNSLSDAELDKMVMAKASKKQPSFDSMSDEELDKMVMQKMQDQASDKMQNQGQESDNISSLEALGESAKSGLLFGAKPFLSGVGGAIGEAYNKLTSPREMDLSQRLSEAYESGKKGFLEEREAANKREQRIAEEFPTASTIGQIGGALATAPLTPVKGLLGAAKLGAATGIGKGLSEAENVGDVLKEGAEGAAGGVAFGLAAKGLGKAAQPIKKGLQAGAKKLGKTATKLGQMMTGVTEKEINTYAKKTDQVDDIIKKFGPNIPAAADELRQKLNSQIQNYRVGLSKDITNALRETYKNTSVDASDLVSSLESAKSRINKKLYPELMSEMDDIIGRVTSLSDGSGKIPVADMYEVKEFLQDLGRSAYRREGKIFSGGDKIAKMAANAARIARRAVNEAAPEIKKANNKLSELHTLEKRLTRNLLSEGASEAGLIGAGRGTNQRNVNLLKKLGNIVEKDVLGEAEMLAAAKQFESPTLTTTETTGKGLERVLRGGAVGGALGGLIGGYPGAQVGGAIGAGLTSPAAIKAAIKAGKITAKQGEKILRMLESGSLPTAIRSQGFTEKKEDRGLIQGRGY